MCSKISYIVNIAVVVCISELSNFQGPFQIPKILYNPEIKI